MYRIEDYVRQAGQLSQQGHSVDEIAEVMHRNPKAIERWLVLWEELFEQEPPWFKGLDAATVASLRHAGVETREDLVRAWENGEIRVGHPEGIGTVRLAELRQWLEATGEIVKSAGMKAIVVDLTADAEVALLQLERSTGQSASQIISGLLVKES